MPEKEGNLGLLQGEGQINVIVAAFLTVITLVFAGLLITKFDYYDISVKIPILFLIISFFAFLYTILIYSNAQRHLVKSETSAFTKITHLGDSIGEYVGFYLLVFAIPLVINLITTDEFLRITTLIVALGGLIVYHITGVSIMGRHYDKGHYFFLILLVLFEIVMFFTQINNFDIFFVVSVVMLLLIFLLAYDPKE